MVNTWPRIATVDPAATGRIPNEVFLVALRQKSSTAQDFACGIARPIVTGWDHDREKSHD
jgi:hypothetical protein